MNILGSNVLEGFRKGKTLHSEDKYTLERCMQRVWTFSR